MKRARRPSDTPGRFLRAVAPEYAVLGRIDGLTLGLYLRRRLSHVPEVWYTWE